MGRLCYQALSRTNRLDLWNAMKTAFLFPGQGAQKVGMALDLYEAFPAARSVFDQAEEVSGLALKRLCFKGPEEELNRTDVAQPAIFAVSAAILAVMRDVLGPARQSALAPAYTAGLSLGEYTAFYAVGGMDLVTAVKLVTRRGQAMQAAAEARPSGMVGIIGLDETAASELCRAAGEGQMLTCANFNCPGQIVLSGAIEACERAAERAADFGASGAVPLKVAGAFHSEFMAPAADWLAEAMADVAFAAPEVPVVCNVDGAPTADPDPIRQKLLSQLVSPVRWQQSMEFLLDEGVEKFYEIGPGRVLAGLMRRIRRRVDFTSVNSKEAVEKLARAQ